MAITRSYIPTFKLGEQFMYEGRITTTKKDQPVDMFITDIKNKDLKVKAFVINKDLLDCYDNIPNEIKNNLRASIKAYQEEAYIINKGTSEIPDDVDGDIEEGFIPVYSCITEQGYPVEVIETQIVMPEHKMRYIRDFYICDKENKYKYKVFSQNDLSEDKRKRLNFEPMEDVIRKNIRSWISDLNKNVINAVRKELANIKSVVDEVEVGNLVYKAIEYKDGSFCIQKKTEDESTFTKYLTFKEMYTAFAVETDDEISKLGAEDSPMTVLRHHLNTCRIHLANENNWAFIGEMGVVKGLLLAFNSDPDIDLEKVLPQEKHISMFQNKFYELTSQALFSPIEKEDGEH